MYKLTHPLDLIVYHANCPDGTSAAWCFSHYIFNNDRQLLIPATHNGKPLNMNTFADKTVLFVVTNSDRT